MNIRLFETGDLAGVHQLLASNRWEYFLDPVIDERGLAIRDEKFFSGEGNVTLVYIDEEGTLQGFVHFDGVKAKGDDAPSFTLCVGESARGKGVGSALLKQGITYVFEHFANVRRIYATTREDNVGMQKTFEALGFRLEATHKKEWENRQTGEYVDSLGYALLRDEFTDAT